MARDAREQTGRSPIPRQTLLMQALAALMRVAARQLDPPTLQEMVRSVGAQLGRQALFDYCWRRHADQRVDGYTWAECLKEIGEQFGWTLRVAVESEGVVRVSVLGCQFAESEGSEPYLCQLGSGLFGGAMAEAIGDVKVCMSRCSETPPIHCEFAIYYRQSEQSQAASGVVYPRRSDQPAQLPQGSPYRVPSVRLTPREAEVLRHIAQGSPDRAIAAALRVSVRTVENHAARIRKKLRVSNRAALVRLALDHRLVDP